MSRRIKWLNHYKSYYDVYFQSKRKLKKEIKYAKRLSKYFNSDIYMVPQVKTNGIRTADYWIEKTNQYWDLKIVDENTKFIIDNIMRKSKGQTKFLLIKLGKTNFISEMIKNYILDVYFSYRRTYINEVILLGKKDRCIIHIKRK